MNKEFLKNKLEEYIHDLRLQELTKKTLIDYRQAVNIFIDFIKNDNFVLDKELLLDYGNYLEEKYLPATYNKYVILINKFLKYLGYDNLFLKKQKIQQKTSIDDPIWEQEHKRMLRWANKLGLDDMYLIIKIFAYTGIRCQELKAFKVENIDNYISVKNKGKNRKIILRNDLKREIKQYCRTHKIKEGYIFRKPSDSNNPNKMISANTVWRRLKRIAGYARINKDKIKPHGWRHLFAKEYMATGGSLDELADILGHSKLETTRIYTMTSNKEKRLKMERMKI